MTHIILGKDVLVPLIINGEDVASNPERQFSFPQDIDLTAPSKPVFQGADIEVAIRALDGAQKAFPSWARLQVPQKRAIFHKMAEWLQNNDNAVKQLLKEEVHCDNEWASIQVQGGIGVLQESAAAMSSEAASGQLIPSVVDGAITMVFPEPYGVVLGIAPWNAPLVLGLRSVCAPLAAGNTVIFKGSELSPRIHFLVASLFRWAGGPAGVCNFILHRPQDAVEITGICISHEAVRKINFTGSTRVGRSIATAAAQQLKPVLLELGGKNMSIVLEDADLARAAGESLQHALLNNGQVCMATDMILVHESIADEFSKVIHRYLSKLNSGHRHVMTAQSRTNLANLVAEASAAGAKITQAPNGRTEGNLHPVTLLENLPADSSYHRTESFGPLLGIQRIKSEQEAVERLHDTKYGLSCSIFSKDVVRALQLGRRLNVGAVHINGGSVHDEANFPHGGVAESGYGRFGGVWAIREFTKTKTVMLYP